MCSVIFVKGMKMAHPSMKLPLSRFGSRRFNLNVCYNFKGLRLKLFTDNKITRHCFMARDGTNSFKKMMVFRTAELSTISFPCFKEISKRGLHSKTVGRKILIHQTVSDFRKKKYNYLNRTSLYFKKHQINIKYFWEKMHVS